MHGSRHYFRRIGALNFAMRHDGSAEAGTLDEANVVLLGPSRTSKTPLCIYLGNCGIKAGNVLFLPETDLRQLEELERTMVVGLTASVERIIAVRRSIVFSDQDEKDRLALLYGGIDRYFDVAVVKAEVEALHAACAARQWPVLDSTLISIEEMAGKILQIFPDWLYGKARTLVALEEPQPA